MDSTTLFVILAALIMIALVTVGVGIVTFRRGPASRADATDQQGVYIGTGIAIGVGTGVALGAAFDSIALGIAIGAAIGVSVGTALETRNDPTARVRGVPRGFLFFTLGVGLLLLIAFAILYGVMVGR